MAFVFCLIFALVVAVAFSLRPRSSGAPVLSENLDIFALSTRYRPMLRLLEGSDFEMLNEAGDPALMRRIRSQRRAIFRGYLRSLRRDHTRLCAQVRALIVQSETDREDLASTLLRMEMTFQRLMFTVQLRLALHAVGIGEVTAAPLMNCFEQVRVKVEQLSDVSALVA